MSAALGAAIERLWTVASKAQPSSRCRFLAGDVRLVVSTLSRRLAEDAAAKRDLRQDCAQQPATPGSMSPETGNSDANQGD